MKPLIFRALVAFVLLIAVAIADGLILVSRLHPAEGRALWAQRGILNYEMRVVTVALPVPVIALDLTIRDQRIIDKSIVACDNPSEPYHPIDCETIQQYYSQAGAYTVEQLLDIADECTRRTHIALNHCPALDRNQVVRFASIEEMHNTQQMCQPYFQSDDLICFVEYDADYGYPKNIFQNSLGLVDGISIIQVEDFQVAE